MLRPSISVWGLTETALQTTGEGDEILVTSGLEQRPLAGLSDVAVETVVKEWRVGRREQPVKELTKEAEAIVVGGRNLGIRNWRTTTFVELLKPKWQVTAESHELHFTLSFCNCSHKCAFKVSVGSAKGQS